MFSGLPLCLVALRWDRVRRTWQPDHHVIYSSAANRRDLLQPSAAIHRQSSVHLLTAMAQFARIILPPLRHNRDPD
jgi:hypothetical protein